MERATARLFDAMAEDYDHLEPWYEHLYDVLHPLLADALTRRDDRRGRALDAGCGTGFQAALLEKLGWETHGIDIAPKLLDRARHRLASPALALASLEALPYGPDRFDVIACCGSTLSFVDDPRAAIRELGRVLRPGGRLLVECEHRFSLDLGWALVSALARDCLGYGMSPAAAWRRLARRPREGCTIDYPGYGRLRLFTRDELAAMFAEAGLRPVRWWGIHSITNLIPSTVLHRERLGSLTAALYRRLCVLDRRLGASAPGRLMGNSLVVLAERE